MKSHGTVPLSYCPDCRGKAGLVIGWKPPQGIDPLLRAFKCLSCGSIHYKVISVRLVEQIALLTT